MIIYTVIEIIENYGGKWPEDYEGSDAKIIFHSFDKEEAEKYKKMKENEEVNTYNEFTYKVQKLEL